MHLHFSLNWDRKRGKFASVPSRGTGKINYPNVKAELARKGLFPSPLGEQGKSTEVTTYNPDTMLCFRPLSGNRENQLQNYMTSDELVEFEVSVPSRGTGKINLADG